MNQNTSKLVLLVLIAFIARVFLIWVGRPQFVGWFNHTYYYYVETQGILNTGRLPFPDMPLLFYTYALTAKFLTWFGMDVNVAIVHATRFWMCLVPACIPIPVYQVFRRMYKGHRFPRWIWALLVVSAFYPLTLVHLPEFLQKNTVGLLLLAILMHQSKTVLETQSIKNILFSGSVFILIVLTHYGSTAVALLFLVALVISLGLHKSNTWVIGLGLSLIFGLVLTLVTLWFYDFQRLERVGDYIDRIFDSSSLGLVFSSDDPDKFSTVLMLLVPLGLVALLYYGYQKCKARLDYPNSVFWLCNIVFCYLLLLPVYEPLLMARFVNFLTLPLIFVITYTLQYTIKKRFWKRVLVGSILFGTVVMAVGDSTSLILYNRSKEVAFRDLLEMKEKIGFTDKDLIITRNGAEHISNWFLDTKSSLITSVNRNDFKKYDRIFIMNPSEGAMRLPISTNEDTQKYNYMLSNIQEPSTADVVYASTQIRLVRVAHPPEEWVFDANGNWTGYK